MIKAGSAVRYTGPTRVYGRAIVLNPGDRLTIVELRTPDVLAEFKSAYLILVPAEHLSALL